MPLQQALPTWISLNNMNSASQSGQVDPITGFPYAGGGLNLGDYFDLTEQEANQLSYPTNGTLHEGRYRYVQVAANATAANIAAGRIGYLQPGQFVQNAYQLAAGSGMTVGTSVTLSTTGGGTGATQATIQVVVLTASTISVTVLTPGAGFTSTPSITVTGTGGSVPTLVLEMNAEVNLVTSADIPTNLIRPVVFLNSITPGNYGFVQELGVATVLNPATTAQAVNQFACTTLVGSSPTGYMAASSASYTYNSIGYVIDPVGSTNTAITPFKIFLTGPTVQG